MMCGYSDGVDSGEGREAGRVVSGVSGGLEVSKWSRWMDWRCHLVL